MHSPLLIKATLPFDLTICSSVDTTTGQFESGKSLSSHLLKRSSASKCFTMNSANNAGRGHPGVTFPLLSLSLILLLLML